MPHVVMQLTERERRALDDAGIKIVAEGTPEAIAEFFQQTDEEISFAVVWLDAGPLELTGLVETQDVAKFEIHGTPTAIASNAKLIRALAAGVSEKVNLHGLCVLDLGEFGLSPATASEIAKLAKVEVSAGAKAVFVSSREPILETPGRPS